jgi:glycosyltransferase involved in cell wall biosynthesis
MRILFLSSWLPYPLRTGCSVTNYNAIKQLAKHHEISLLSFIDSQEDLQYVPKMAELCHHVTCVLRKRASMPRLRHGLALLSPTPRSIAVRRSLEMIAAVKQETGRKKFDCAVADGTNTIEYMLQVKGFPKILYHHNVDSALAKRQCILESSPHRRLRLWLTWLKGAAYEKRVSRRADAHVVVSEVDRDELLSLVPRAEQIEVVGNGVDIDAFRADGIERRPNTLIFTGLLKYGANLDGLRYFQQEILPVVKRQWHEVAFRVTGDFSGLPIDDLRADNSIVFTGYLDDIKPEIASSWISIAPIRVGSGTRLKILEALALGTPVVSTTVGAEGLNVQHERDILIADNPQDFARQILRLRDDHRLWQHLSENGRRVVEEQYDWKVLGRKLEEFMLRVSAGFSHAERDHTSSRADRR